MRRGITVNAHSKRSVKHCDFICFVKTNEGFKRFSVWSKPLPGPGALLVQGVRGSLHVICITVWCGVCFSPRFSGAWKRGWFRWGSGHVGSVSDTQLPPAYSTSKGGVKSQR